MVCWQVTLIVSQTLHPNANSTDAIQLPGCRSHVGPLQDAAPSVRAFVLITTPQGGSERVTRPSRGQCRLEFQPTATPGHSSHPAACNF